MDGEENGGEAHRAVQHVHAEMAILASVLNCDTAWPVAFIGVVGAQIAKSVEEVEHHDACQAHSAAIGVRPRPNGEREAPESDHCIACVPRIELNIIGAVQDDPHGDLQHGERTDKARGCACRRRTRH